MKRDPRQHDEAYLARIRQLPCCVCLNDIETEAAHVRMADLRAAKRSTGKGEKPHDRWAIPLCGKCHRLQHEIGEKRFWDQAMIDPIFVCLALSSVEGSYEPGLQIVQAQH